ncbi:importin alpha [Anaeramoeba flamelloides]|uniref:Importin subunit alpha n=1 Tax=Anaeramoeba flamelloides TaxID=1746091 RepID=A0ABQ8XY92_9EUKA|nr:importin alpha [Anaeramoeba flamelloides]
MNFKKKLRRRKKLYKSKTTRSSSSKKRLELILNISKQKKDQLISKKRNLLGIKKKVIQEEISEEQFQKMVESIPEITNKLMDIFCSNKLELVKELKEIVSLEHKPPFNEIINSGVIKVLVEFLNEDNNLQLQFETAWILSNIASGTSLQTKFIVDHETIPIFIRLLNSKSELVCEQAVWAIGNIAIDCIEYRNYLIVLEVFPILLNILINVTNHEFILNILWTLSNLIRGEPQLDFETNQKIINSTFWALSYLSIQQTKAIPIILELGIIDQILIQLKTKNREIYIPSIRLLGHIASGNTEQTQQILDIGVLSIFKELLKDDSETIRRETCWVLYNICSGTQDQIQEVIDNEVVPILINILKNDKFSVKRMCCYVISNIVFLGSDKQRWVVSKQGVLVPLSNMLGIEDIQVIFFTLEAIEKILILEENYEMEETKSNYSYLGFINQFEDIGGLEQLDYFLTFPNSKIRELVTRIIDRFYPISDQDSDELFSNERIFVKKTVVQNILENEEIKNLENN